MLIVLSVFMVFLQSQVDAGADIPDEQIKKLVEQQQSRQVIMVGENHVRYDHHLIQLEFLRQLYQLNKQIAIGAEWFQQPFQPVLDDFIAGNIDEATLLRETGYYNRWRYDYRLYRPIMDFARQHKIPVIALNVSSELTAAIREHGIDNLPAEFAAQLPDHYDTDDQAYRDRLQRVFEMHPEYAGEFEHFYRGQLTWDEGMAQAASLYLQKHPQKQMLIFAGAGHLEFDSGIPSRIKRRTGIAPFTVIVADDVDTYPAEVADEILISSAINLPPKGRLGVILQEEGRLLLIRDFANEHVFMQQNIPKGSAILSINKQPIRSFADLKILLLDLKPAQAIDITILPTPEKSDAIPQTFKVELI